MAKITRTPLYINLNNFTSWWSFNWVWLDRLNFTRSKNETKNIEALNTSDIVDTTGAGDFYAAGYIFGQLITSNLDVSLELGSMLAANAIKQIGASPTDDVANEIFKKYPQFARW